MTLARLSLRHLWRLVVVGALLAASAAALTAPAPAARAQTALRDYPIPGGWFFSQESRQPKDIPPFRGYTVEDDGEAAFWTEFLRHGGVEVLGYPVSQRYHYPGPQGFLHQAFQRGILQWRPEKGEADLANVFEQFTEVGRDDVLETVGISQPRPPSDLPFALDAARRMGWITEPRFLARFLYDPMRQVPFETQEAAWMFFGLPQNFPERPVYLRERANGKFGHPLYQPYVVQRFQKGALQLFLEDVPNDPTVVPGDGRKGCVAITAAGRLARRLGAGVIIPGTATQPLPLENPPKVHFIAYVPPVSAAGQTFLQFEMIGTGFDPGEPVTIRLKPVAEEGQSGQAVVLPVVSQVDAADADGSFDQLINARVGAYTVELEGLRSGKKLDPSQDPVVDLTVPTPETEAVTRAPCF